MEDDQRKDALLACVGKKTFGLLRALVAPTKLKDKTFGELVETLRVHLAPKLRHCQNISVLQEPTKFG